MKLTEREHINLNESYAYEVLRLAKSEKQRFLDVSDYLPFYIHESEVSSLNHIYQNRRVRKALELYESNLYLFPKTSYQRRNAMGSDSQIFLRKRYFHDLGATPE